MLIWIFEHLRDFFERGGGMLYVIAGVICLMWTLIFDRIGYLSTEHRVRARNDLARFVARRDQDSWYSVKIYDAMMSRIRMRLEVGIPTLKALTKICPLLGLLGTVLGMITIFSVMGIVGSGSPRAVAGGVSTAIITTMAGMVGALSGIYPAAYLSRKSSELMKDIRHDPSAIAEWKLPRFAGLPPRLRVSGSLVLGFVVATGLMLMMERMIVLGQNVVSDRRALYSVDYVRVARDESVQVRERIPDRPENARSEPHMAPPPEGQERVALPVTVPAAPSTFGLKIDPASHIGGFLSDGEYLPIVKVAPVYPRGAAARHLEGWVLLSFTVTTAGSVRDIDVVESTDEIFEKPAIAAAERFRYKPRVIDGQAVEVRGVLNRIYFILEELERERRRAADAG